LDIAFAAPKNRRFVCAQHASHSSYSTGSTTHHHPKQQLYLVQQSLVIVQKYKTNQFKIMPRPTYTLYVPEASFRAFAILIAAEYNGVTINVNTDISNASKSPVRKLPILELNDGKTCIFSSQASTRYVASIRHDVGLMGQSAGDAATIDAWMDWCTADVELPACVWFYPVAGYMPFNAAAYVFMHCSAYHSVRFNALQSTNATPPFFFFLLCFLVTHLSPSTHTPQIRKGKD
jgi:hypothetical protein